MRLKQWDESEAHTDTQNRTKNNNKNDKWIKQNKTKQKAIEKGNICYMHLYFTTFYHRAV